MRKWLPTVAIVGLALADHAILHDFEAYQAETTPYQTYYSSKIASPIFNSNIWHKGLTKLDPSDHLFLTLDYTGAGPYIFRDDDLSLVYADPSFDYAMNARVQLFNGTPWLTFWHGARNRGDSQGFCVFYDQHYRPIWNVTLGAPLTVDADMHECEVTFDDRLLLTAYQDKAFDLSSIGGETKDVLADSCFQEVDIREGTVYFTWCASEHFTPDLTYWNYSSTFDVRKRQPEDDDGVGAYTTSYGTDVYHINSVQKTSEGNYLVSLRNLKSLIYVDGKTGQPMWNLNGKLNNFTDITDPKVLAANKASEGALGFGWQHHARFWDNAMTKVTLFDNHELSTELNCTGPSCSRGREIRINTNDLDNLTVELIRDYRSHHGLNSVIFGSMHPLPYPYEPTASQLDKYLISWGVHAAFSEHTSTGRLIRDVQYSRLYPGHSIGRGVQSFRVYKQSWHGYPHWPPSVVADHNGTLWVSWNGATEVHEWAVYGSETSDHLGEWAGQPREDHHEVGGKYSLEPLVSIVRAGFETKIELGEERPAFVKIAAMDVHGEIIGCSETVWMGSDISFRYKDTLSYISLSRHLL